MSKGGISSNNSSSPTSSNACTSLMNSGEDALQRPMLPAWEVLEAIPFVLEAILTACVHGRLSSRDLTTGLLDASFTYLWFKFSLFPSIWSHLSCAFLIDDN